MFSLYLTGNISVQCIAIAETPDQLLIVGDIIRTEFQLAVKSVRAEVSRWILRTSHPLEDYNLRWREELHPRLSNKF